MSSRKRRIKRKIAMFQRLDKTYHRLYLSASVHRNGPAAWRLWFGSVIPLGDAMQRRGHLAWQSLKRCEAGTMILMHNYTKRRG